MDVEEPLAESAPLARQLAPTWCRMDPRTGGNCAWFHGFWQYLRLLELIATPKHHTAFYGAALGAAARSPDVKRVLVAGAADYGMLAQVIAAFRHYGNEPEVTVSDVCETPLRLNEWYAGRVGCPITTNRCDMLEYPAGRPFDVVCTHSFLGEFPPCQRLDLVRKWHEVLRPGGVVVTVKRIRPDAGSEPIRFTADQARAFEARVREAARSAALPGVTAQELADDAKTYAERSHTWPLKSREEIAGLFEQSSFRVDRLDCSPVASAAAGASGPTALGGAPYVQIVATRL